MNIVVSPEFIFDFFKLALYICCTYLALNAYGRYRQAKWLQRLTTKRFAVLALLTLLVVAIKIFEDVVTKESGPVDAALLWFIRQVMPPAMANFFSLVTLTGSAKFLVPATAALSVLFFVTQHRRQAVLLAASMACGWVLTYTVKSLVDRSRPELWSTTWYWGSSFPSGHTLSTAAFATALAIGAAQIWPKSRYFTLPLAVVWVGLMALSRLVLGVHWPTDVLAAICLGIFIPLAISLVLDGPQQCLTTESEHQ
jgi:undecaprenyl-diphosphatase